MTNHNYKKAKGIISSWLGQTCDSPDLARLEGMIADALANERSSIPPRVIDALRAVNAFKDKARWDENGARYELVDMAKFFEATHFVLENLEAWIGFENTELTEGECIQLQKRKWLDMAPTFEELLLLRMKK